MSGQHTPGPWHIEGRTTYQDGKRGVIVCHGINVYRDGPEGSVCYIMSASEADERVMIAAPDLLAAGNVLSFAAQTSGGTAGRDEALVAAIDAWAAAIARATGPA
jgi:hypothetical protein